jgi:trehalose synthase-fused probable maltokinase
MQQNTVPDGQSWLEAIETPQGSGVEILEAEILPAFIEKRRWYASKDKGRPVVHVSRVVAIPTGAARDVLVAVLQVEPPDSPPELYLLGLAFTTGRKSVLESFLVAEARLSGEFGFLVDAAADDAFVRAVLGMILETGAGEEVTGRLAIHRTDALDGKAAELLDASIKRGSAEQSNTSVMLGDVAVLKLIRKLQVGVHPEPEIGVFLTDVARFPNTPALLGYLALQMPDGPVLISVLQAFVRNEGDGWEVILGRLKTRLRASDGEPLADIRSREIARQLGVRTAELHRALATPTDDPAFAPEVVGAAVLDEWIASVEGMATRGLDGLARARSSLPKAVRGAAERLLDQRDLPDRIKALRPQNADLVRTRIHGDYHLGQVLIAPDDVYIVDFEGEPMRSLSERRQKHSPLRDVAGMLRSIAYAAGAASREALSQPPAAGLRQWTETMSKTYLDAYRETIVGCPSYPSDRAAADRLLTLFLLDKAFYEVTYELANRPDWVGIPLTGIIDLLGESSPSGR